MFQTWIGDDIRGTIDVSESLLVQFNNMSNRGLVARLHTSPERCRDLVGIELVDSAAGGKLADGGSPVPVEDVDPDGELLVTGHKIDYRRAPFDSDLPFPLIRLSTPDGESQ